MTLHRSWFAGIAVLSAAWLATAGAGDKQVPAPPPETKPHAPQRPPNFVIIVADDLGYGDLGCYGSKTIATPRLDALAAGGARFTDFYVAAPFCSPSRASLLTGRYPAQCGVPYVLFPAEHTGLPPGEITLAELLQQHGYATACIGKWHLGWDRPFRPRAQGFDEYFGLPHANDSIEWPVGEPFQQIYGLGPLPLFDGDRVVEAPVDQSRLTLRYTERAVRFIHQNQDRPFFLYLPHTMPHIPQYASAAFAGRSKGGIYGDVIEELDWSTGQILDTLAALGLAERTLVVFTSDNGAVVRPTGRIAPANDRFGARSNGGSVGPLRGRKGNTFEGGMRVPAIVSWPGQIAAGQVIAAVASTLDLFPTLARLAGAQMPRDRFYPGKDLTGVLRDSNDVIEREPRPFYYYFGPQLQAVRRGEWKLFLRITAYPEPAPVSLWYEHNPELMERQHRLWPEPVLYDLSRDIGEAHNVAADHPDVVEQLTALARDFDTALQRDRRAQVFVAGPKPPAPGQIRRPDEDLGAWQEAGRPVAKDDTRR